MKRITVPSMILAGIFLVGCSDDSPVKETYKGFFTDSEGGMIYDYYQEPDTTVLVLNASNVPCDFNETIEEVPCGDTPIYFGKTYILTLSDNRAALTIGTASHKYDYVADRSTRTWNYHPGEYAINLQGFENYKRMANVHKAVVSRNNLNFKTEIRFFRKKGDKEELAFVSDGKFDYVEYGPKRMNKVEFPASVKDYNLIVSKSDEYNWTLTGEDVEYRFHIQDRLLVQTKPVCKTIGVLSYTK